MDKYFIVFKLNTCDDIGRELSKRYEVDGTRDVLRGFATKRKMLDWLDIHKSGLYWFQMLKPIT